MRSKIVLNVVALAAFAGVGTIAVLADDSTAPASADAGYATAPLSGMAQLGKKMFVDVSLSASGRQSCESCHDPRTAYAPSNALAVQLGGPHMDRPGIRAVPSLDYMGTTPVFEIGPESLVEMEGQQPVIVASAPTGQSKAQLAAKAAANPVPEGGYFWDGRADTLEEQPSGPLLSPFEMANTDVHAVVEKLKAAPYAGDFKALFGPHIFDDETMAMSEASFALARYEVEDSSFHPFSSKYDAYLAGKAELTPTEAAGLQLFEDPKKGNCSSCHLDEVDDAGRPPMLTDFEYEALAVPRNPAIPANANPTYYDLGICGPMRTDAYSKQAVNCALFKTPTLRNVATRHVFFHNGFYTNLTDVLHFYVERDTNPDKIYPRAADGNVQNQNDVPLQYRANVDVIDAPFDRHPGQQPALNDQEIGLVIAFLGTLTDGYSPQSKVPLR
jgi:cytochrome c peroxidase